VSHAELVLRFNKADNSCPQYGLAFCQRPKMEEDRVGPQMLVLDK